MNSITRLGAVRLVLFGSAILTLLPACVNTADTRAGIGRIDSTWRPSYTDPTRLRYNGYVFLGDVLKAKEDLRKLREFSNLIGFVTTERNLRGKYPGAAGEADGSVEAYLKEEGERIRLLDSLGFTIGWPLPLSDLVNDMDLERFRRELRIIERHLPEMALVDIAYIFDEPNFRDVPTETLEDFVDAFKEVFPHVKVWFCYAIVHPKFLDAVPPRNADILGIDPYMISQHCEHTAAGYEHFYRQMLACALEWVNRWDKPFILAGDCFRADDPDRKKMPDPETTLWYYHLALTQPKCIGIIWFYYGSEPIESENLNGLNFEDASAELIQTHRSIGEAIFGEPTPLGLQWETFGPPAEEE